MVAQVLRIVAGQLQVALAQLGRDADRAALLELGGLDSWQDRRHLVGEPLRGLAIGDEGGRLDIEPDVAAAGNAGGGKRRWEPNRGEASDRERIDDRLTRGDRRRRLWKIARDARETNPRASRSRRRTCRAPSTASTRAARWRPETPLGRLFSTSRPRMSTRGLSVNRVPPPEPVSRSHSGSSPAPGSAGPRTSAATTATTPTREAVRSTVGALDFGESVSHPGARSSSHAVVERDERERRGEVHRAREQPVVGPRQHRDEEEDAGRGHDRLDDRVEPEGEGVSDPRRDPHRDERPREEAGLGWHRGFHDRELIPHVERGRAGSSSTSARWGGRTTSCHARAAAGR